LRIVIPPPQRLRSDAPLGVLDVSEYFGASSGGVRTYLLQKRRFVADHPGLRQVLVTPGAHDAVHDEPGSRWYQLRGPAIPFQPSYRFLLATRSVRRIIDRERPDLIEVGSSYFAPWVGHHARRHVEVPVVWFYHANLPRLALPGRARERTIGRAVVRGVERYVRHIGRVVDATLAASDFSARELARCGVDRVHRVTLGVDTARFHPVRRAAREAVRKALGVADGPLVGFVGRFAEEKHVADLVAAWPAIERATGGTLVLAGHGPAEPHLRAAAAGRRIRFLPFERDRDALANLLAALDLYLSPAPYETFGLAVCEALACGTPVLSVDHGAAAELVRHSAGGALAPVADPAALARAAIAVLDAPRGPLSDRARAYVEREHAWPAALGRLFATYRQVMAA